MRLLHTSARAHTRKPAHVYPHMRRSKHVGARKHEGTRMLRRTCTHARTGMQPCVQKTVHLRCPSSFMLTPESSKIADSVLLHACKQTTTQAKKRPDRPESLQHVARHACSPVHLGVLATISPRCGLLLTCHASTHTDRYTPEPPRLSAVHS